MVVQAVERHDAIGTALEQIRSHSAKKGLGGLPVLPSVEQRAKNPYAFARPLTELGAAFTHRGLSEANGFAGKVSLQQNR